MVGDEVYQKGVKVESFIHSRKGLEAIIFTSKHYTFLTDLLQLTEKKKRNLGECKREQQIKGRDQAKN